MRDLFVDTARVTLFTVIATYASFIVFTKLWAVSFELELDRASIFGMLYLNELTMACIGIAAGYFTARYHHAHPFISAAIAAVLVETLHASASGAFKMDPAWRTLATMAVAAAVACASAWLWMRVVKNRRVKCAPS